MIQMKKINVAMSAYKKDNLILNLTFRFAIDIMRYCELLEHNRKFMMARQLWRSGTAIGALAQETQNAESRFDFIHKIKIAGKEADESMYWISLWLAFEDYPDAEHLEQQINVITKIINKIISSTKQNQR